MAVIGHSCRPAVTVVMAAYNAELYIERAIESVLDQSLEEWELICVNDGSTDNTWRLMQEYQKRDVRIRTVDMIENVGQALALCRAYQLGNGKFFLQLDSDDRLDRDCLHTLYSEAQKHGADCVVCDLKVQAQGSSIFKSFYEFHGMKHGTGMSGRDAFALTFPWNVPGICLWSERAAKSVGANPEYALENEYVTRELFLASDKVYLGSGVYYYSYIPGSASKVESLKLLRKLTTIEALVDVAKRNKFLPEVIFRILDMQRRFIIRFTILCRLPETIEGNVERASSLRRISKSRALWEKYMRLECRRAGVHPITAEMMILRLRARCLFENSVRPTLRIIKRAASRI